VRSEVSLLTDSIVVDDVLRFGLGSHDGVGAGGAETGEDGAYEINDGRRGGWATGGGSKSVIEKGGRGLCLGPTV